MEAENPHHYCYYYIGLEIDGSVGKICEKRILKNEKE